MLPVSLQTALLSSTLECPASSELEGEVDTVGAFRSTSVVVILRDIGISIGVAALLMLCILLAPTLIWDGGSSVAVLRAAGDGTGSAAAALRPQTYKILFALFIALTVLAFGFGVGYISEGLRSVFAALNVRLSCCTHVDERLWRWSVEGFRACMAHQWAHLPRCSTALLSNDCSGSMADR